MYFDRKQLFRCCWRLTIRVIKAVSGHFKLTVVKQRSPRGYVVVHELKCDAKFVVAAFLGIEANVWKKIAVEEDVVIRKLTLVY